MKLGTSVRAVVFLAVLGWAGYTIVSITWSYFTVQEFVEKALRDASARHRAAFVTGSQVAVDSLASSVRSAILLAALHEGLQFGEGDVSVSANSAGLSATVRWSYPVVRYEGDDILVVPMWVKRSIVVTP